jgi:tripartite-type tricarboxylate transporter receptor subunit TctC
VASAVIVTMMAAGSASAQEYPSKPVRIYANAPGGILDYMARVMSRGLAGPLGQPIIVENRPGNVIPAELVSRAPPDGYHLLSHGQALMVGALLQKMRYDPYADFQPISMTVRAPLVVVVHPSLPAKSIRELIALAKAKPGLLNYAIPGMGATSHLATELFKYMTHVDITSIPYKGAGAAMVDMLSGEVQLLFSVPNSAVPHIRTGRLRPLAVTSAQPTALFPGLPTIAASGVPGYEAVALYGLFAPAKTPEAIIRRLHQEIVRYLDTEEAKKTLFDAGLEPVGSTPEQFAAALKAEMARVGEVIKAANIRLD